MRERAETRRTQRRGRAQERADALAALRSEDIEEPQICRSSPEDGAIQSRGSDIDTVISSERITRNDYVPPLGERISNYEYA